MTVEAQEEVTIERDTFEGRGGGWIKPLTNADVLEATTPLGTAPYTYDTLVGERTPTLPWRRDGPRAETA